jgi:hypothetical protein
MTIRLAQAKLFALNDRHSGAARIAVFAFVSAFALAFLSSQTAKREQATANTGILASPE